MTATEWLTIMVTVAAIEALYLTLELLYLAARSLWRAFQRELDADTLRRNQAETAHYNFLYGGSAGRGVETPPPAPGCPTPHHPGAGPELQAGDSRLDRGSAATTTSVEPQPAPGSASQPFLGAGPKPRTAALSALPSRGEAAPPTGRGGPGHEQTAGAGDPRYPASVVAEPRPDDEGAQGCASRVGAVHETAPTTRSAA
jgi:hypothetical protein